MDYRNGKCSSCGAEYKIPTSFAHDVAKCKQCSGVVRIEPAQAAARSSAPVPAKRVEKRPAPAAPTPVGSASAEQKRKERGTLAKLRAQRAAAEEAPAPAKSTARPKPAAAKARPAAAKGRPAAKPVAGRKEIVTTKGGTLASRSRKSSGKTRDGEGEEGFSSRRGAKSRKKEGIPMGGMIAVGGVVVLLAGAGLYFGGIIGGGEEVAANEVAEAPIEDTTLVEEPVDVPEEVEEAAAPEEAPVEEAPKVKAPPNPADVKLDEIEDFGPARGTTDEEWTELNDLMATFMDLDAGAKGPRAGRKLEGFGRKAYPVIVNHMKTLDFADPGGYRKGDMCQKTLEKILNGRNFGWKYDHEENYVYYDRKVVENYAKSWRQVVTDVNAWISMAKLEEKDPQEAARLRQEYGSGGGEDAVSDDDLDVD